MLYLVPSPIGNLADITFRAIEILKSVDLILAEDTRTSSKLLRYYNIEKPTTPYHQHNEHKIYSHLVDQLSAGKTMALISKILKLNAFLAQLRLFRRWSIADYQ
jgi:16S rRNA (cytidine1402-2'-O)-methyltransferase